MHTCREKRECGKTLLLQMILAVRRFRQRSVSGRERGSGAQNSRVSDGAGRGEVVRLQGGEEERRRGAR